MMDPRTIMFDQELHKVVDDEDNRGENCYGCIFNRQRVSVCMVAAAEAVKRGLRDCDAVDQFGEAVIYIRVQTDPRQLDLIGEPDP